MSKKKFEKDYKKNNKDTLVKWEHPGGKLIEQGAKTLTDAELLSIIISPGIKGRTAEAIAKDLLEQFQSIRGMLGQPLKKFLKIKGLGDVKIIRIAATIELAYRIHKIVKEYEEKYGKEK